MFNAKNDSAKALVVQIDGQTLSSPKVSNPENADSIDQEYTLPTSLTEEKETITVRFTGKNGPTIAVCLQSTTLQVKVPNSTIDH